MQKGQADRFALTAEYDDAALAFINAHGLDVRDPDERDEPFCPPPPAEPHVREAARQSLAAVVAKIAATPFAVMAVEDRLPIADGLRWISETTGDPWPAELADQIAGPPDCEKAIWKFREQIKALKPDPAAAVFGPTDQERSALRATADTLFSSPARCTEEFDDKAGAIAMMGAFAMAKRACPAKETCSSAMWRHLSDYLASVPTAGVFAEAMGYAPSAAERAVFEDERRYRKFVPDLAFIREMIEAAGPAAVESLKADVERLNRGGG